MSKREKLDEIAEKVNLFPADHEYVRRGAVRDMLYEEFDSWGSCLDEQNAILRIVSRLYDDIPAADVAEVKRGRWERYADDKFIGYDKDGNLKYRKVYKYECSKCLRETAVKSDFCPNCGADMRGDGDG